MRRLFTVLAVFAGLSLLQGCGHDGGWGGGGGHRHHGGGMGGPGGGPGGPGGPPEGAQLKQFDLDADGKLTRDELGRALHIEFDKWDKDKDGVLNTEEARALNDERRKTPNGLSPVFDWNADGHIDFKEFANQLLSLFDRLDADSDGVLTEQEMMRPAMGPGGPGGPGAPGGRGGGGGRGRHGGGGGGS
jgi:Ca2+-binding EF-hand superfamily protein